MLHHGGVESSAQMSIPPLTSRCVNVFFLQSAQVNENLLSYYRGWLSQQELTRLHRFRFMRNQKEFLLGKALTRYVLARYCGNIPRKIGFKYNAYSKPFIDPDVGINFNLSHSQGTIVLAVCLSGEIGVDIEFLDLTKSDTSLPKRYFAPQEYQYLSGLSPRKQTQAFFSLWTLKESYIKAVGHGLSLPLSDFAFDLSGSELGSKRFSSSKTDEFYWFHQLARVSKQFLCAWSFGTSNPDRVTACYFNLVPERFCFPMTVRVLAHSC